MFIRATDSRFWSRPIILLPSAFLGDPANRYGGMPASGVEEITPDTSEGQPSLPTADLDGHSSAADAFMASQPYLIPGAMPMDSFFATNSSSSAAKPRHRKNRSTKTIVKAEDIPEYKGQMPVDDLVNFINSGKSKKASVKKKMVKTNGRAEQSDGKTNGDAFSSSVEFDETEEQNSEKAETEKESIFNEKSVGQHVEMETPASTTDSRTEGEVFPADSSYWKDFTPVRRRKKGKIQQQMEDDGRASNSAVSLGHTKSRDYTNPIIRETKPSHFAANKHETPPLNNVKINKPNPEVSHSSQASCNCLHSPLKSCTSNACKNHETLRKRERCDVLKMKHMHDIVMKNDNQCSIVNSMALQINGGNCPAAGITSQPEPVIFVDRKDKGYTKIDISFGFDVQDSDCGPSNEPSEVDVVLPESCSCRIIQHSPSNAGSLLGSREGIGDSVSVNDTDENNNHEKHHGHGCCHTIKQAKSTPPTALLHGPEASHLSVPTKRISTSSPNEGRIDSLIPNVKCSVHCNCSGRPISVVAPNQPLNGNTHNRLISTLNQGTVTGQKQPLGTVKQQESVHSASPCACIVPSLGHNVGQTLSCSPATGSCGPAPVLKVAPMLVENLGTTSLATDESVDGPVKEDISRKSSILNSKDDENGQQKHIKAESGDYQENPQNENERTETVEINKETQSPIDQICSTVDKNFHHSISPQDRLTFSQPQSQVPDQNDPLANEEEEEEEEVSVSSDVTADHSADVYPDVSHHPAEDRFDLFFAQIFLYKTYEDCISAPYTVVRKIRTTDSNE